MKNAHQVFAILMARYQTRAPLSDEARAALLGLPFELRTYPRHAYLVREGEQAKTVKLVVEGLVYRHRVTTEGSRQILSIHIPGDFVDLEGSLLNMADHNVQALQTCVLAEVPRAAVVELIDRHGPLARAMWVDTLIDASVYREWIVNVGRRDAKRAMCHLLCEFGRRLEAAGQADGGHFELPMTQDELADCLGITPVHVNRIVRELDEEGVIVRRARFVEVPDRDRLSKIAGFSQLYLHLDMLLAAKQMYNWNVWPAARLISETIAFSLRPIAPARRLLRPRRREARVGQLRDEPRPATRANHFPPDRSR